MIRAAIRRIAPRVHRLASAPISSQRGVVLIAALWICALIMWFALQISAETRLQGEDQIHSIRKSQAFHLAVGGCYEALARMGQSSALRDDEPSELNWQPDGKPRIVRYQGGSAVVIVESEDSKVNVNRTGQVQIKQILEKAGMDEASSENIADCILDFIDKDDTPRIHGAEKDAYKKAGLNYVPFNGPFTSLDQLLLIPGITQELFYGSSRGGDTTMGEMPEGYQDFLIPGKYSLFSMLTIYGNNVNLPRDFEGETETDPRPVTWKAGGTYRVLSFGKTANGPPSVGIWLTVRLSPDNRNPYKILSRKVL
jgi:Type II secretion system (T2SS), protein K